MHQLRHRVVVVCALVAVLLGGCATSNRRITTEQEFGPDRLTVNEIQAELMSYADNLSDLVAQAADEVAFDPDTTDLEIRLAAIEFKLQTIRGAYTIAAGPNPVMGVVDMAIMVTLTGQSVAIYTQERGLESLPNRPIATAVQRTSDDVWALAGRVLQPEDVEELHRLIDEWRDAHPRQKYVANIRLASFAKDRSKRVVTERKEGGSLFGLLGLDPLANLDPTTREIEQSRLLAERIFFYVSRMPLLLGYQVEELTWGLASAPESQAVLADLHRFSDVAERYANFAEGLPKELSIRVADERKAALEQAQQILSVELDKVQAILTAEREAIVSRLDRDNTALDTTLGRVNTALDAGHRLVEAVDGLTARFESDAAPDPDDEPVQLADIQATIEQTTVATAQLNSLVSNLDAMLSSPDGEQRIAELQRVLAIAEASGARLINRIFLMLAGVIVLVFAGLVVWVRVGRRGEGAQGRRGEEK